MKGKTMEKEFIIGKGNGRLSLKEETGVLSIIVDIAGCEFRLETQDLFDEVYLFRSITDWKYEVTKKLTSISFTAHGKTCNGCLKARYTMCFSKQLPTMSVSTNFKLDESSLQGLPVKWMHFPVEGFTSVHCVEPEWNSLISELSGPISFKNGLVLSGEKGCMGFFHSGEPLYNPKVREVCPDPWKETTSPQGFRPINTAVITFASNALDLVHMKNNADIFYKQIISIVKEETAVPIQGETQKFGNNEFNFTLKNTGDGIILTDLKSFCKLRAEMNIPIVQLRLRNLMDGNEFSLDSRAGWDYSTIVLERNGGRVFLNGIDEFPELSVEVTFRFISECRIEWNTEVLNGEQNLSVISAAYPTVPWSGDRVSCFIPEHSGWVASDVTGVHFYRDGIYPRGWRFTMGYFAAYTDINISDTCYNGMYFGIHDRTGALKSMAVETDVLSKTGIFSAMLPAPDIGKGGNSFSMPGPLVWQMFSGDWYDATLIYKEFVHTKADWLPDVGQDGREDTPKWARELPFWIMDWMPNTNPLAEPIPTSIRKSGDEVPMEYWYEEPIKLQKELGTPIGYHVYNWHWIPFNNDYPYYLPAKKEFCKSLKLLQDCGIYVMPYTNARLWDTRDKEGEDATFTLKAKKWATKRENGELYIEQYESHEPDGSLCSLTAMCPSSGIWKSQMAEVLKKLFREIGVNGVYLDQIAAAAPYLCMDPSHHHLPGGGSWWTEQYNLMVRRYGQIKGPEGILTTEDNAEVYAKSMDAFLTWIWTFDNLVPAFSVIYSGYIIMFGRSCNGVKKGDYIFFKYQMAEQLLFGGQLGWINADVVQRTNELKFLKKMVNLRYRYSPFFYKGELLRPVQLTTDQPVKLTMPAYYDTCLFEAKQVLAGIWRLWDGTKTILLLINCAETTSSFTAEAREPEFTGAYKLEGNGLLSEVKKEKGGLILTGEINAEDFLVVQILEEK